MKAEVVIKCPTALRYRLQGYAQNAAREQKACDDPAEPRYWRTVLTCRVTPKCQVDPRSIPVNEELIKGAQAAIYWHDHGMRVVSAKCVKTAVTTRFTCGVRLERGLEYGVHLTLPIDEFQLCLAVTARSSVFRWKVTDAWERADVSVNESRPYRPHCTV